MRILVRRLTLSTLLLLCAAAPAMAATSAEFYLGLLQRGIAFFEGEHYPEATTYLKLAAFGLVDSIENYQKAQVYLTLNYDRLGDPAKARDAARRVIAAERVQRTFASLTFPAGVASSFDTVVTKLLGSSDAAYLKHPQSTAPPPAQPTQPQAAPAASPQATTSSVSPVVPTDPPKKPPIKPAQKPVATPHVAAPAPSKPAATSSPKALSAQETAAFLAAGDRAVAAAHLAEARSAYRSLLEASGVPRETLIRVGEGLYRARDFSGSLEAFAKIGPIRRGEEPYHYYMAVASYETGQYARAKTELSAAIPFIEITPDVARYRSKIEGATD